MRSTTTTACPVSRFVPGRVALLVAALLLGPSTAAAQTPEPRVGVVLGHPWSQQVWTPSAETEERSGFAAGVFTHVTFPGSSLGVRAGAEWVRRGTFVTADGEGNPVDGEVATDYLSFPIHLVWSASAGVARVQLFAGPTIENLIQSRTDAVLAQLIRDEKGTVLAGAFGAAVGVQLGSGVEIVAEGRWTEGLSDAYTGPFVTMRNRSRTALLRLSVPLSRIQGER